MIIYTLLIIINLYINVCDYIYKLYIYKYYLIIIITIQIIILLLLNKKIKIVSKMIAIVKFY